MGGTQISDLPVSRMTPDALLHGVVLCIENGKVYWESTKSKRIGPFNIFEKEMAQIETHKNDAHDV